MVIFRVTENINIKTTDGTLVKYNKLKNPSNLFNETVYVTTFEDYTDLKRVFSNVGDKYRARVIDETKIRYLSQFPRELGVSNLNEYSITQNLDYKYKEFNANCSDDDLKSMYLNENKVDLDKQLEGSLKEDISIVIIGNLGQSISEMICSSTALRLLNDKLKKRFRSVKLDIYLNASDNKYYSRDKSIFTNQSFINKVSALSIDVKQMCQYDFFIDASSVSKRSYYSQLSHIDAWLYKFGIDYTKIDEREKYNTINISLYHPKKELKEKINNIKLKGKTLLFHPYSANITKSIPKEIAIKLLKELLLKLPDYTIVSVLKLESKFDSDRYVDLSSYSNGFLDYCFIVSNMDKIITVNTATYHIADAFFIPTLTILTDSNLNEKIQHYTNSKAIYVEDKSKNFSNFVFQTDSLILYKFEGWSKLKSSRIIKLLETF
ncbi:hypothetical protein [Arcobacter sp. LA11]|uniref:hypothetical protein n=1 Tax=Arcobacter sp. LA11 TaxID=1898176 RepID=UPI0009338E25|nr:hypothetical protein [Arcobacter sp. LA11]